MKVFRDFYDDESGITVIEIVLVLVGISTKNKNVSVTCIRHIFSMHIKCITLESIDFSNDKHNKYGEMCIS